MMSQTMISIEFLPIQRHEAEGLFAASQIAFIYMGKLMHMTQR